MENDTIYREEAIKKIAEHLGIPAENWMKIAEEWLRDVPSAAQPEERALHESCTDCPLYDKNRHSCPRFNKVIPETLRELQSAQPDFQDVLGWLLAYHTKSFDLHGRYLPNEVIAWLINDFTHNFIAEMEQDNGCS